MVFVKTETAGYVIVATTEHEGKKEIYPVIPRDKYILKPHLRPLNHFYSSANHADEAFSFTRISGAVSTLTMLRNRLDNGCKDVYVQSASLTEDLPSQNYNLHALRVSQIFHEVAWADARDVMDLVAISDYLDQRTDPHHILRNQFTAANAKVADFTKEIAFLKQDNQVMSGFATARMTKTGDVFYQGRGHISMPEDYKDGNRDIAGAYNHSIARYAIADIPKFATIQHGKAELGERFFVVANSFTLDPEPTSIETLIRLEAEAIIAKMPIHLRDAAHRLKDKAHTL